MAAYPRSQTIAIFVVCVLVVAGAAVYASGSSSLKTNAQGQIALNPTMATNAASTTADWQKSFFAVTGTTSDPYQTPAATAGADSAPEQLTSTDIFGRDFLTAYMQLYDAGADTDQASIDNASDQIISDSMASIQGPVVYSVNSLDVTGTDDRDSDLSYAKTLASITGSYLLNQNEAVIASNALDQQDMSLLKNIDPIIANYQKGIAALLAMPVPPALAEYHLDLVNGVSMELYNAQSLRNVDTDPVRGLVAVSQEVSSLQTIETAMADIQAYLATVGIEYAGSSPSIPTP